ncbi:MAG: L-2-hydroxyglutarate oxidase [Rhodoluna sp.]|nr:L-2-hydroxyglutarate oxidase [Rhodoluna sp.]
MKTGKADYLIIGGGVVGLAIAKELKSRFPTSTVAVLEKEPAVALHASGRNSGVLHAGFYYSPESLKAKLTRDGNERMRNFCIENGLPLLETGKVVVAQRQEDVPVLSELHRRGVANGVDVELVDPDRLAILEPLAETIDLALWSPRTAVADPAAVALALESNLRKAGVDFYFNQQVSKIKSHSLTTKNGDTFEFGHLVNAAGLYSDVMAKELGFGERYSMIPFIGLYFYAPALKGTLERHIYPTPDPRNPFLGVHFTKTAHGDVKVGPTAIPILSREQYGFFEGLKASELLGILANYPRFIGSKHHDVWSLVKTELPKLSRKHLLGQAAKLTSKIDVSKFTVPGKPGIRAQLFDKREAKLEMDFVIEGDENSTHVLNAVSPGWTSCFSFAEYVVNDMELRQKA